MSRVHDPIDNLLMGLERPGLAQQGVDERGLAVVDMGDDRHVSDVRARRDGGPFGWSGDSPVYEAQDPVARLGVLRGRVSGTVAFRGRDGDLVPDGLHAAGIEAVAETTPDGSDLVAMHRNHVSAAWTRLFLRVVSMRLENMAAAMSSGEQFQAELDPEP